jgi:hypothetical protein
MKLLSKDLVSPEYLDQLQQDLAKATVCRFLVAYVSAEGLNAIQPELLLGPMRNEKSFGIASLTCSCGYRPLITLQGALGDNNIRLKYFMDPMVTGSDEPNEVSLFHSKLVCLFQEGDQKCIVYIGSHNWSTRALGPTSPRNIEASMRLEFVFAPEDLDGIGDSIPAQVNRHLLDAWNSPVCYPATKEFEPQFTEWMQKACGRSIVTPVNATTIILAVCKKLPVLTDWPALQDRGIYMQSLDEDEGKVVWESSDQILLLVWESDAALVAGQQPIILNCTKTASNAGPESRVAGRNQAESPMEGLAAIVFDETSLTDVHKLPRARRQSVRIWSGRDVEVFDFEFPTVRNESSQIDGGVRPLYQFYLQTEAVIFPATGRTPPEANFVWEPETFAVADNKNAAQVKKSPGYFAEPDVKERILAFLRDTLRLDLNKARVLPYSDRDAKVGKRVSYHPLHDTYIGSVLRADTEQFYSKSRYGMLIPEIGPPEDIVGRSSQRNLFIRPVRRVQQVFTMPLEDLFDQWRTGPGGTAPVNR